MSIVSFSFLVFLLITVICYYIFPRKYRWAFLLIASILFFLLSCEWKLLLYLLFGILATYIGTNYLYDKCKTKKQKKITLFVTLFSILSILCALKYINIFPITLNAFGNLFHINFHFGTVSLLAPLGLSYYTLSLTGYVIDVYREAYEPQKNILKHALFSCYYPIMISGPFVRYNDMKKELFEPKEFDWNNLFQGFYRIMYGLMKKLVIADLLAPFVRQVFTQYNNFTGFYIINAVMLYAIQIYADFSGCMDIVNGASKMYGITLIENFESPFFSKNLSEFWRRWHISLGAWAKDYIMYPLLKSSLFQNLGKTCKKKFGKKIGKKIPTLLSIFILWFLIGLWHGASYKYIFAAGILPWIYLTLGEMFGEKVNSITKKLKIKTECFSFRLFQSFRTILLMCFIWLFACAPNLGSSLTIIKNIFIMPRVGLLYELPKLPMVILFASSIVIVVDYLKYKNIDVLNWLSKQNIWFRWIILFIIIFSILIYGAYGPGYNASDFIYGGF